ncbi:hypothetical protein EsHS_00000557 [Epichloe bromicola]
MVRSSSGGRSREKPPRETSHDKNCPVRKHMISSIENLKPASPPKTNPWTTKRPATTLSPDWPSITPDFASINGQSERRDASTAKRGASTKHDTTGSCSTDGKAPETSPPSRKALQAAAPRAGKSLWLRPFGADVFVRVGPEIYEVHRSIVEPQSIFFRQHLPPQRDLKEYIPIDVQLELCPKAVGNTLRFMYTQTLEICEYDRESPRDLIHIPRSVLLYIGAIDLGVDAMKTKILQILQQTAKDLAAYLQAGKFIQAMSPQEVVEGVIHLRNALEVAYSSEYFTDMLPLRLALCQLLDTLLPFLIRHPVVIDLFSSSVWKKHADVISTDLLAARNPEQQPARNVDMGGGCPRDEGPSHEKALSSCIKSNAS